MELYIGSHFLWMILVLCFWMVVRRNRIAFVYSLIFNIIFFAFLWVWWLNYTADGIAQGIGIVIYGGTFIFNVIILGILTWIKNKPKRSSC
ncbi:hypothetical protein [Aneurinibacillus tyrosinisolvens]|uniref:hypothetical protein n=1 Tax=Aneurinibacillus tyrosinisolvens TaxID=1443435 RepID=UPI00063F38B5|nr:hypothetical protein [Aneurinibacillus tyrosinisolvens]